MSEIDEAREAALEAAMKAWIADRYRAKYPHLRRLDVEEVER